MSGSVPRSELAPRSYRACARSLSYSSWPTPVLGSRQRRLRPGRAFDKVDAVEGEEQ